MGFNSTWKRRCPLILLIKEGSLSSGSASVLLSEGSEASPLCRERNWIRSLFQLLSDFNLHARAKAGVTLQSAAHSFQSFCASVCGRRCVSITKLSYQFL